MKKENTIDRCPVCGGENKSATKRTKPRPIAAIIVAADNPQLALADDAGDGSSDDQTADAFAALLPVQPSCLRSSERSISIASDVTATLRPSGNGRD